MAARKSTVPGMNAPVMHDSQPISMFKQERRRTPKAAKVEEPVVEQVVEELVVEATPALQVEAVKTRRCPGHGELWPEEAEARPMTEYHYNKTTGKLASGYCHRCNIKHHSMYAKQKRVEQRGPSAEDQLNEALQRIDDLTAQVAELEALNTALQEQPEAMTAQQQQTA